MCARYLFKTILAGAGGAGKTTLLRRYTTGTFDGNIKMTIGVDFSVSDCETKYGPATLQIWDFAGEERFRNMLPKFCMGARGCLMLFDPLRPKTFYELSEWLEIIRSNTKDIPILLISSKQDLIEEGHTFAISQEEIDKFIEENHIDGYMQVSSKTGYNVKEAFTRITELMIEKQQ